MCSCGSMWLSLPGSPRAPEQPAARPPARPAAPRPAPGPAPARPGACGAPAGRSRRLTRGSRGPGWHHSRAVAGTGPPPGRGLPAACVETAPAPGSRGARCRGGPGARPSRSLAAARPRPPPRSELQGGGRSLRAPAPGRLQVLEVALPEAETGWRTSARCRGHRGPLGGRRGPRAPPAAPLLQVVGMDCFI